MIRHPLNLEIVSRRLTGIRRQSGRCHLSARGGSETSGAGFSLIEVMFAIAFLGFGLLAVAQMMPLATRQVVHSKQLTDAVEVGQSLMEELKMDDYGGSTLTAGTHTRTVGLFNLSWLVTVNEPVNGSKRVDLTVTWNSSGQTETATMSTYFTR